MRRLVWILTLGLGLVSAAAQAQSESKAKLWARWQAHDSQSTATIDNGAYDAFLKKYVVVHRDGPNGVRYGDVSSADRHKLEHYIQTLENVDIDHYNRHVQRAYWLNLYNAETIDLILQHYPIKSVRDIGSLLHHGPWQKKVLKVAGQKLTLNDISRRILRPIWTDGLTLYGLSCGAISCASLRQTAYTGSNVYAALYENAEDYVNSPEGVRFDHDGGLKISKIYDWYKADFGGDKRGVINHIRRYAAPQLSVHLEADRHIAGYDFDWSLNSEANVTAKPAHDH
ncbi:DUF547 domain-containing protein [Salinisphaera sp. RV14]|uniref:DUF547 domain-containing protein n=1 Tax=unclassified Salinisphaera TaxID=2649847 RepID=UPI003F86BA2B